VGEFLTEEWGTKDNELINTPVARSGKKKLSEVRKIEWRFVAPRSKNTNDE
jgi:hypothetical protein